MCKVLLHIGLIQTKKCILLRCPWFLLDYYATAHGTVFPRSGTIKSLADKLLRYLHEINEYDNSLALIDVGCRSIDALSTRDTGSEVLKGHLYNTFGVVLMQSFE